MRNTHEGFIEDIAASLSHTSTATTKAYYLHNAVDPGARRVSEIMQRRRAA